MYSKEELEIQYTPSLFSKRFSSRAELKDHFLEFSSSKSQECRLNLDCHLNISYGTSKREKLDIYGDNLPDDVPLFIFIHGGYWQELDKDLSGFVAKPFVDNSIRVIVMEYDTCPNVKLEEIVEQINLGFKWISNYIRKRNIKKISIAGHSAGAHLLSYAISESFLKELPSDTLISAYFLSGIYSLNELRNLKGANDGNLLSITDENWKYLSPQFIDFNYLKNYSIKIYIFAGEFESDKFKEHSRLFAEGPMKEFQTTFKILDVDHFDMIEKLYLEDYEITRSIIDNLKM